MPIMDGFEAALMILNHKAMNSTQFTKIDTKIIALTSYTDEATHSRCKEIGFS